MRHTPYYFNAEHQMNINNYGSPMVSYFSYAAWSPLHHRITPYFVRQLCQFSFYRRGPKNVPGNRGIIASRRVRESMDQLIVDPWLVSSMISKHVNVNKHSSLFSLGQTHSKYRN